MAISAAASAAPAATIVSYDWGTSSDLKALYTQTYTIFTSLQHIHQEALLTDRTGRGAAGSSVLPSAETIQYYNRISEHYARAIQYYLERIQLDDSVDSDQFQTWRDAQTILRLAEVLYYPKDGRGISVVGEELLHWLNSFDVAPTTEEGQEIAESAVPHEHPSYWDYVLRCVLRGFHTSAASVLKSLDSHSSSVIRRVAQKSARLLSTLPRSTQFSMEHEFVAAHRSWLSNVRKLISGLEQEMDEMEAEGGNTEEVEDERLEYEAQFRCLLELMAGVKDRIFEACEDWREALGAWGTLVHPTLKRDDVPTTAAIILEKFPIDGTVPNEIVQQYLIKGQVRQAVQRAQDVDIWLGAHLGDLADKVGLLEDDNQAGPSDLRQSLLLKYAQSLLDEQGLWRISIDYLAACGAAGRKKMSHIILSVPLDGPDPTEESDDADIAMDEGADGSAIAPSKQAKSLARAEQVLRACSDHGLELEARVVCRRMSRTLMDQGQYGVAIAYCVQASDTVLIRTIAERILGEYVSKGAEAFIQIVDSFPSSLISPADGLDLDGEDLNDEQGLALNKHARGFFSNRLAFLARFRDFHRLYADGQWAAAAGLLVELVTTEAAPERFLAVLLVDAIPLLEDGQATWFDSSQTFELIRIVERITNAVSMHPDMSDHFLGYLDQLLGVDSSSNQQKKSKQADTSKQAQPSVKASDKLDAVRLSLARNLARVGVMQAGIA
ncbi:Nucleoporin Nup85-like protein [Kalmanozyma brasiliensis GHG001]|uniref:Nuclear pore complex protein Nup85 n=1 Tax=Kalmanozyma brasiliensis (strain GHG001) TaxID=1365824 RepID=V5F0S4_KALBG|nr:Nucleoporin Nup85-like protein [Kalmanozyma brasiliensis GHG001]EST08859.1 Nucleoporin Nup85-like protein [Kalmanozyma brasiliensis GHG001]